MVTLHTAVSSFDTIRFILFKYVHYLIAKHKKYNLVTIAFYPFLQLDEESDTEVAELDLGTKIKTPKEVMLEELSLLKNKGSKMFQMRQQRVDKFIVTNENLVSMKKTCGCCVYACVCVVIYNISFYLPAEPPEPTDNTSPCPTKA